MKVVIVESPAKAKTINKYLGKDYDVYASFGHVRDLPAKDGSVDPDDDFAMLWEVDAKAAKRLTDDRQRGQGRRPRDSGDRPRPRGRGDLLARLRDPEGQEASSRTSASTAWCSTRSPRTRSSRRCAIPREIDEALVDAYLARRALDYLVGFNLSPVLWRKLPGARSAGRVQSVALRIVCDRELEIEKFVAREYWSIVAHLKTAADAPFTARLVGADGKKINRLDIGSGAEAEAFKAALETAHFSVVADRIEAGQAPPLPALHHLDPAAGGLAQARLRAGAHDADRPAPL